MTLHKRVLGAGKIGLLVGALLGTFGLFALAGLQIGLRTREVATPDLSGRTLEEVSSTLAAAGLSERVEPIRRIHRSIEAGRVVEQDPEPGVPTRRSRVVKVWLSSGPTTGAVPTLIGESEGGARRRLSDNAFALDGISEIRSSRYPTDAVVAQEPPPAGSGHTVSLLVNRGERGRTYVMPDLIGINGTTAAEILRTRGFRVTVVGDHPYPGVPSGVVLRHAPQAGFQIAPGEPISLEVSR